MANKHDGWIMKVSAAFVRVGDYIIYKDGSLGLVEGIDTDATGLISFRLGNIIFGGYHAENCVVKIARFDDDTH